MSFGDFVRKIENKKPFLSRTPLYFTTGSSLLDMINQFRSLSGYQTALKGDGMFDTFSLVRKEKTSLVFSSTRHGFNLFILDSKETNIAIDSSTDNIYTAKNIDKFFEFKITEEKGRLSGRSGFINPYDLSTLRPTPYFEEGTNPFFVPLARRSDDSF